MSEQVHALASGEGPAFWFANSLTTVKATSESTGGAYMLIHQVLPPGFATPYHSHRVDDEACYVLDGQVTFFSEGKQIELTSGGYISLPHGTPHGFRNGGGTVAEILFFDMPGDAFLGFLHEAAEPAKERRLPAPSAPDFAKLARLSDKYGIDVFGPLPG